MADFKSWRSFQHFEHEVRRKLRYVRTPDQDEFLKTVLDTSHRRKIVVEAGSIFWRAQIGHDWRDQEQDGRSYKIECAYSATRMKPIPDRASDGRANPKGIPSLYLSTKEKTAISEVRPWIGVYVSVGQFATLRNSTFVDCSRNHNGFSLYVEEPDAGERESAVWTDIDRAFAQPMTRHDNVADYAPTQIIAELFKRESYDGVVYKSHFGVDGYNVALFDLNAADLINCTLYKVEGINIEYEQQDSGYFVTKYYPGVSSNGNV